MIEIISGPEYKTCWYCGTLCGKRSITYDHFTPASAGGSTFVNSCRTCNIEKDSMSVEEYREFKGVVQFHGEKMGWIPW